MTIRDDEDGRHGQADEGDEGAGHDTKAADQLRQDRRPGEKGCRGHVERLQYADEGIGAAGELRIAMLHEAEADDQPEGKRPPGLTSS